MPRRNHQHTRAQGAKRKSKHLLLTVERANTSTPKVRPSIKVGQTVEQWRREQGF